MAMVAKRFDVCLVNLDPTAGSEIQKTGPCLVISPDEMNRNIRTVIIGPITTAVKDYPTRVNCAFGKKQGQVALDQIRTIDQTRLVKKLGTIDEKAQMEVISVLQKMFAF
ncbi:MAG: type II toxin-antitoxin system PemK/MazF family toxin [Bacteroidales bacterium]